MASGCRFGWPWFESQWRWKLFTRNYQHQSWAGDFTLLFDTNTTVQRVQQCSATYSRRNAHTQRNKDQSYSWRIDRNSLDRSMNLLRARFTGSYSPAWPSRHPEAYFDLCCHRRRERPSSPTPHSRPLSAAGRIRRSNENMNFPFKILFHWYIIK